MPLDPKDPALQAFADAVADHVADRIRSIVARDGQVPIPTELRKELDVDAEALAKQAAKAKDKAPK